MYALALKGKIPPKLLTSDSITLISNSIAWSFIPRGNDTHFTVVLLVRFGALAEIGANRYDLGYDFEPERTLLRRRREARHARQAALQQELNMAAEHHDDNMNMDNQNRITIGQYSNPTADSCGSTIRRPAIQANNFEINPSLIQLVQQDQFSGNYHDDPNL
ncbi:hypothetical protein PIB30_040367 [Stylosanthes scabra]|uniref:Uncharacterized protein n=1 Tax=Stylosanthes scabra TaxID=79078 RepID=A0ABU6XDD2_9FABA|nr:hypothetical protein [Stylosanthes scabra]